ncbi:MAG: family 43 glycosylhydrolase, partial [Muribaculaceae bacterium]|nr:family 43 glycosylhydrolase [Muribaculaceae bacterium]
MKRNTVFAVMLLGVCGQAMAVHPLPANKPMDANNPIFPVNFCADPTAVVYDGRVYVYGSNDQQELDETGNTGNNTYGKIKQLVCLSSADMANWTWHDPIKVDNVCSWMWNSWAPSVVSREEADGKTHFYMYFANGASGIGVMTATSPTGPWTDPIKRPLINGSTPGIGQVNWLFDPGAVVDDNGDGWLAFGGGDPNSTGTDAMPGNARIVKLGADMVSFASEFAVLPAPYHFEASELNIIGGKFVYSYSSSWAARNDWQSLGIEKAAPAICSIAYMTSDDPLDPASWEYQGDMIKGIGSYAGWPGGNNHSHLQKFGNKYYMFYHMQGLSQRMGYSG